MADSIPPSVRKAVHERAGDVCERCGAWDSKKIRMMGYKISRKSFPCHHVDGPESILENLALLCKGCHQEWHFLLRIGVVTEKDFWGWAKTRPYEWMKRTFPNKVV